MTPPRIRQEVEDLVIRLLLGSGLTPVLRTTFGITSDDHSRAFRDAIDEAVETRRMGLVLVALNQALGDGVKLTAFVRPYAPHWSGMVFHTIGRSAERSSCWERVRRRLFVWHRLSETGSLGCSMERHIWEGAVVGCE